MWCSHHIWLMQLNFRLFVLLTAELQLLFMCICPSALQEARAIDLHLQPLGSLLSQLEEDEFSFFHTLIPPVFHLIFLVWTNCSFYRSPARIVGLLQVLCNLLIQQVWHMWQVFEYILCVLTKKRFKKKKTCVFHIKGMWCDQFQLGNVIWCSSLTVDLYFLNILQKK